MQEGELELWKHSREGDREAREELILSHLPLVKFWAGHIARIAKWANRDDLVQDGIRGLMEAVDRFDPYAGSAFKAYARQFIRGAIFRNPELSRDLGRHQLDRHRNVKDAHDHLMRTLERAPTLDEIAGECGLTTKQVLNALDAMAIAFANELPEPEAPGASQAQSDARQYETVLINEALSRLTTKEALIVTGYYWAGESDAELAKDIGSTQAAVSRLRQRAIIKLRTLLDAVEGK